MIAFLQRASIFAYAFLWWLIIFCNIDVAAQNNFSIERLSIEDGLSHRWANQIVQDDQGFIWIALADGLNRYDGYEFKHITLRTDTTQLRFVRSIQFDKAGILWLEGTEEDERFTYDPTTGDFKRVHKGNDFFEPKQNAIIITTAFEKFLKPYEEMYDRLDWMGLEDRKSFTRGIKINGNESAIIRGTDESFWVWHNLDTALNELRHFKYNYARYDLRQKNWQYYYPEDVMPGQQASYKLSIDENHRFWYPSFNNQKEKPFSYIQLPDDIAIDDWLGFRVDNRLNLWFFTNDFKAYRADRETRRTEFVIQLDNKRVEVYEDRDGTIWMSTESGIQKIRRRLRYFENYLNEPFDLKDPPPIKNSIGEIIEPKPGHIIANHAYKKMYHIVPAAGTSEAIYEGYPHDLIANTSDYFYFSDGKHIVQKYYWEEGKKREIIIPDNIPTYSQDLLNKRPIRVSGLDVPILLDTLNDSFEQPQELDQIVTRYIYWDQLNHLAWSNVENGIMKIGLEDMSYEFIPLHQYGGTEFVRGWQPEGDSIWIATIDGLGVLSLRNNKILRWYTDEDGLPHKRIYSLLRKDENLWLGTENGLSCFNPKSGAIRNFYVEDGLSHNEFNTRSVLNASDGKIWMGGLNGINVFDPEELKEIELASYQLYLTKFEKYNARKDTSYQYENIEELLDAPIQIGSRENEFSFQFMLNDLSQPDQNQYLWYIEGLEKEWAHVNHIPIARYQNIAHGSYTLKVKALNHRGVAAQNELSIPIIIKQIWYKRWWAWVLYSCALFGLVAIVYRFQLNRNLEHKETIRLKELDEVKTKLYTNITHEFRTPLTVILGMADQIDLKLHSLNDANNIGSANQMIKRNGEQLLSLVNQMLDLSKLESGKIGVNYVQSDIVPYIKYIAESFQSYGASRHINVAFNSDKDTLEMDFDPEKMLNIVSNLLSNAIKFSTEGGGVSIHLSTLKNAKGKSLLIKISDTGIGIPEAQLANIFDRFYQVDDSATRQGEGTGIGLTLVKEFVNLLGGKIKVESKINEGSTFSVYLPISNQAKKLDHIQVGKTLFSNVSTQADSRESDLSVNTELPILLVIEDNFDVAQYIRACLENEYRILHAPDGKQGIDLALEQIPDIIISDVMMPEMDGFEVVDFLKNDERTSHIPIILLTAKADVDSKITGLTRGADAYLAKPFNKKELSVRLQKLIELRKKLQAKYSGQNGLVTKVISEQEPSLEDIFLSKVREKVIEHLDDLSFSVPLLCRNLGMSQSQLYRKLKAITGRTIVAHIRTIRLQEGKKMLQDPEKSISQIAYDTGFSSLQYFSDAFFEAYGKRPSELR